MALLVLQTFGKFACCTFIPRPVVHAAQLDACRLRYGRVVSALQGMLHQIGSPSPDAGGLAAES